MDTSIKRVSSNFLNRIAEVSTEREVRAELSSLPDQVREEGAKVHIVQAKLDEFPGGYVRVRSEEPGGYYIDRKNFSKNTEDRIDISKKLFEKLINNGSSPQDKIRYKWNGWDVDVMDDGRVVAEFELQGEDSKVDVPFFFDINKALPPTVAVPYDNG
jgi:hypothetical protein